MDIATLRSFFLWCLVFNYVVLVFWFVAFLAFRDQIFRLHSRWFSLSRERFDTIIYQAIAAYKLAIIVFNVAPLIALLFVG